MQQSPYIHLYEDGESKQRWHGVFALRLSRCSAERDGIAKAEEILTRTFKEQVDLISALCCPERGRTFALRYISHPCTESFASGRIDVAILGQEQGARREEVAEKTGDLYQELQALLGGLNPDWGWKVVTEDVSFNRIWEPFPWQEASVAEIVRREEAVTLDNPRTRPSLGTTTLPTNPRERTNGTVYVVHPFLPRPTTLAPLLRTMLLQPAPILLQIVLRPVRVTKEEEAGLLAEIGKCEAHLQRRRNPPAGGAIPSQTIHEMRASAVCEGLLTQLARLQAASFLMSITLSSPKPLPPTLLDVAGAEVSAPVAHQSKGSSASSVLQGGGYTVASPHTVEEAERVRLNAHFLTVRPWNHSQSPVALVRLRRLVNAHEAAGAFRFPVALADPLPGIEVQLSRCRPLPLGIASLRCSSSDRLLIGEHRYLGPSERVFLTEQDRRHHAYIVGQTGVGKSTLLKTMILSDMAAGRGIVVIDPHGDLFEELLHAVPGSRLDDLVILDPTDTEYPVGLNLLECPEEEQRHFVVREMRAIMERLIRDQYDRSASEVAGPAFYQHMQMNMLLTMSNPEDPGTLLEFYEIFQHEDYWKRWLPLRWKEPQLERWAEKNLPRIDYTQRCQETLTWGEYLSSKFDDFVFDPKLRRLFGQKRSTIDLRQIMDSGKILLVNLAKGELSESNARFLGMVLMAKIMAAAMQRRALSLAERRPFALYVDEFQALATQSFVLLLSEARKFGISLILANQFVSQIKDERIMQAVFGNVGTLISFRVGQEDAKTIEPYLSPTFDRLDLSNLPNWQACVKTTVGGQVVAPFTLRTIEHHLPPRPELVREAQARSRRLYGRPRSEVEREIRGSLNVE